MIYLWVGQLFKHVYKLRIGVVKLKWSMWAIISDKQIKYIYTLSLNLIIVYGHVDDWVIQVFAKKQNNQTNKEEL